MYHIRHWVKDKRKKGGGERLREKWKEKEGSKEERKVRKGRRK